MSTRHTRTEFNGAGIEDIVSDTRESLPQSAHTTDRLVTAVKLETGEYGRKIVSLEVGGKWETIIEDSSNPCSHIAEVKNWPKVFTLTTELETDEDAKELKETCEQCFKNEAELWDICAKQKDRIAELENCVERLKREKAIDEHTYEDALKMYDETRDQLAKATAALEKIAELEKNYKHDANIAFHAVKLARDTLAELKEKK